MGRLRWDFMCGNYIVPPLRDSRSSLEPARRTFRRVRQDDDPGFGALYETDIGAAPRHSRIGEARDERVAWLSAVSATFGEHDRTECARPKRFELQTARFVVSGAISGKQELSRRPRAP